MFINTHQLTKLYTTWNMHVDGQLWWGPSILLVGVCVMEKGGMETIPWILIGYRHIAMHAHTHTHTHTHTHSDRHTHTHSHTVTHTHTHTRLTSGTRTVGTLSVSRYTKNQVQCIGNCLWGGRVSSPIYPLHRVAPSEIGRRRSPAGVRVL